MASLNPLYRLSEIFDFINAAEVKANLGASLNQATGCKDRGDAILYMLSLFDDAIDGTSRLSLREDRISDHLQWIKALKLLFIAASSRPNTGEFRNAMKLEVNISLARSIGDTLDATLSLTDDPLDRSEVASETTALMDKLQSSDWNRDAVAAMCLKLSAFRRILQECEHESENEVRRRIKSIYADFAFEMDNRFPADRDLKKAVTRWASLAGAGTIVAIGLVSDATDIAGYIEDKRSESQIEAEHRDD